jgi:hypothetical protein
MKTTRSVSIINGRSAMVKKILLAAVCACAVVRGPQVRGDDYVRGYTRANGTYVAPYFRTHPDQNFYNNYSTYPNINPYSGQMGTRLTPPYSPRTTFPSYHSPSYSIPSYRAPSFSPSYGWRR